MGVGALKLPNQIDSLQKQLFLNALGERVLVPFFSLVESQSEVWTPELASSICMGCQKSLFEPLRTKVVTIFLLEGAEIWEKKKGRGKGGSLSISTPERHQAYGRGPAHCEGGRNREV